MNDGTVVSRRITRFLSSGGGDAVNILIYLALERQRSVCLLVISDIFSSFRGWSSSLMVSQESGYYRFFTVSRGGATTGCRWQTVIRVLVVIKNYLSYDGDFNGERRV